MAYVKKYATDEERRAAMRKNGIKGAAAAKASGKKLGRPVGSKNLNQSNKNPRATIPPKTLTVREDDYQVIVKCAFAANKPIVEFMHVLAEHLKTKNPKLFSEEPKVEM